MAQVIVGNEGSLNSTTDVTAAAAPAGTDQRIVSFLGGHNLDTISHIFILVKDKGGVQQVVGKVTAAADTSWMLVGPAGPALSVALDATNETVIIKMAEAMATTQPTFHSVSLNNA